MQSLQSHAIIAIDGAKELHVPTILGNKGGNGWVADRRVVGSRVWMDGLDE